MRLEFGLGGIMDNFEPNGMPEKLQSTKDIASVAADSGRDDDVREIQPVASQPEGEAYRSEDERKPDAKLKKVGVKRVASTVLPALTVYFCAQLIASILMGDFDLSDVGFFTLFPFLGSILTVLLFLILSLVYRYNEWERKVADRVRRIIKGAAHVEGKSRGKDVKKMLWDAINAGDATRYDEIAGEWEKKIADYISAVQAKSGPRVGAVENNGEGTFDGWLIQKIGWNVLSVLVTLITLGIAFPVTVVWKEKWRCKHTLYEGKRLTFDGRASQLIGNWLLWIVLTTVTFGIFALFIPGKIKKWKAKHTRLAGEYFEFGATFDGWLGQEVLLLAAGFAVSVCTLLVGVPFAMSWMARWRCNHTVLDGRRLRFDGKAAQLLGKYVVWLLLSVVTLSVYAWFIPNRFNKWKAKHTRISEGYELC